MVVLILAAVVAVLSAPPQQQPQTEPKTETKKNEVVVRGCLDGTTLTGAQGREYSTYVPDKLRLTGNRAMRGRLKESNGHVVELTGVLKGVSNAATGALVKDTGKTKIYVGGTERRPGDPMTFDQKQGLEVPRLDVSSVVDLEPSCQGIKN